MIRTLRAQWFYILLPLAVAVEWSLALTPDAMAEPRMLEATLPFDLAIFLPALYFLFLRGRVTLKAALLRTAALAGSGIWLAAWLMPAGEGVVLPWLEWVRYVALPLLIAVELIAAAAILRHVYGETPSVHQLIDQGLPKPMAKLILAEARFWKRVLRWLRGN